MAAGMPNGHGNANSDATFSNNGYSFVPYDYPFPQLSRKIKACTICRRQKIKCLMEDSGPPCRRCSERNLECVLGKNLQTIIDEKSQYLDAVFQDLEHIHGTLRTVVERMGLPEPHPLQSLSVRDSARSPTARDAPAGHDLINGSSKRPRPSGGESYGPSCDNSPKISPADEENLPHVPIHSLYRLTKLQSLRSPDGTEERHGRTIDDLISRGVVSYSDAQRLFSLYRDRLDAFMYGVGCRYQSLDELRQRSSILTVAILTVSALHDPAANSIFGICRTEFRRMIEKSIFDRQVSRDYLRALCVASYWLSDMSWMLSGHAIRRVTEGNLYNIHTRAQEEQSEEAADGVRVWYILNICDQHLATLYGRPAIVHSDLSMKGWEVFLESPIATAEDTRLASQVALLSIFGSIRELFGPDTGKPIPRAYLHQIAHFNKQLDNWVAHWSGALQEQYEHIGSFPRKGVQLHYHFAKLHLHSHVFRGLSSDSPIPHYFLDCTVAAVSAATSTIEFILTDSDVAAGVVGMPSYLHCMTAFACMFLTKVVTKYGGDLVELDKVRDLITRLIRHFRSVPVGKWHLANLMASGLEKMAETLDPNRAEQPGGSLLPEDLAANGTAGLMGPTAGLFGGDQAFAGTEGDMLFNYDMSFGLSPVFRFDPNAIGIEGLQEFPDVEYPVSRT
ncbi:hypothetical protein B0T10DRAFT_184501 [Thelonectria olida]|uniref:Zn(2)-C6 fungal-type domain-containing protein n=1 Tax=Thelonectria olida TaxID=1576542 RepID=A0A9P9AV77_9HYPO|nr:hypothetical protein B0T10DRAFT_184501 [Thelonectria olida]